MARKHERLIRDYVRERRERLARLFSPRPPRHKPLRLASSFLLGRPPASAMVRRRRPFFCVCWAPSARRSLPLRAVLTLGGGTSAGPCGRLDGGGGRGRRGLTGRFIGTASRALVERAEQALRERPDDDALARRLVRLAGRRGAAELRARFGARAAGATSYAPLAAYAQILLALGDAPAAAAAFGDALRRRSRRARRRWRDARGRWRRRRSPDAPAAFDEAHRARVATGGAPASDRGGAGSCLAGRRHSGADLDRAIAAPARARSARARRRSRGRATGRRARRGRAVPPRRPRSSSSGCRRASLAGEARARPPRRSPASRRSRRRRRRPRRREPCGRCWRAIPASATESRRAAWACAARGGPGARHARRARRRARDRAPGPVEWDLARSDPRGARRSGRRARRHANGAPARAARRRDRPPAAGALRSPRPRRRRDRGGRGAGTGEPLRHRLRRRSRRATAAAGATARRPAPPSTARWPASRASPPRSSRWPKPQRRWGDDGARPRRLDPARARRPGERGRRRRPRRGRSSRPATATRPGAPGRRFASARRRRPRGTFVSASCSTITSFSTTRSPRRAAPRRPTAPGRAPHRLLAADRRAPAEARRRGRRMAARPRPGAAGTPTTKRACGARRGCGF